MGLIGKIRLMSNMTEQEMEQEVCSVFKSPMGEREDFPFMFLQPTGLGSRSLTVPSVSSSFSWTAQQVAKLGGNKCAIYILAKDNLVYPTDFQVKIITVYQYIYCINFFPRVIVAQMTMKLRSQ